MKNRMGKGFRRSFHESTLLGAIVVFAVIGLVLAFIVVLSRAIVTDPEVPFLTADGNAEWVRLRQAVNLKAKKASTLTTFFRIRIRVNEVPQVAVLSLKALRSAWVWADDQLLYEPDENSKNWKKTIQIDLGRSLAYGRHTILVKVQNPLGHPALLAHCRALNLASGEVWEASADGKEWSPALSVNTKWPSDISRQFQRSDRALLSLWYIFIPVFVIAFAGSLLASQPRNSFWPSRCMPTASQVRWGILALWVILAANDIGKVPQYIGMDIAGHLEYVSYVAERGRLPLASEGWQTFQPPLFYMLSAFLVNLLRFSLSPESVAVLLRLIPLVSAGVMIEVCYRTLRYLWPDRGDLQVLGTVVAGFVPMKTYISLVVGNEPLASMFAAVVVYMGVRLCRNPLIGAAKDWSLLGVFLGLSLLTKPTAFLLIPALAIALSYGLYAAPVAEFRTALFPIRRFVLALGLAVIISGWYYIRNKLEIGHFFIGGWDPSGWVIWWQDPSYRCLQHLVGFGESLFYPMFSSVLAFWDSLYSTFWLDGGLSGIIEYAGRPPWNYSFMLADAWFSLLPTIAILLGIVSTLSNPKSSSTDGLVFPTVCVIVYIFAMFYLFAVLPIYSTGKATYSLGILPCYVALCAKGFDYLTRNPLLRAVSYGLVACWAVCSYVAFFVV